MGDVIAEADVGLVVANRWLQHCYSSYSLDL